MEKPLLVAREDLVKEMANLINESKLPLVIVEPLLETMLNEVRFRIQQEYKQQKEDYETSLKKSPGGQNRKTNSKSVNPVKKEDASSENANTK